MDYDHEIEKRYHKENFDPEYWSESEDVCPECNEAYLLTSAAPNGPDDYSLIAICPNCNFEWSS